MYLKSGSIRFYYSVFWHIVKKKKILPIIRREGISATCDFVSEIVPIFRFDKLYSLANQQFLYKIYCILLTFLVWIAESRMEIPAITLLCVSSLKYLSFSFSSILSALQRYNIQFICEGFMFTFWHIIYYIVNLFHFSAET